MTETDKKLVLIVEDTEDLAKFIVLAIKEIGMEPVHAMDAGHAMTFLESNRPDLIILDIGLPGISGWQLLETINDRRRAENIFIIVTTAFQDPANRLVGKLQDVDGYLNKPFRFKELKDLITGLFQPE
ncbi:MAG: response regulator [Aggregatilineales bacterium]